MPQLALNSSHVHTNTHTHTQIERDTHKWNWVCIPVHNEPCKPVLHCTYSHMWLLATSPSTIRLKVIAMSTMHLSRLWPRCHASLTSTEDTTIKIEQHYYFKQWVPQLWWCNWFTVDHCSSSSYCKQLLNNSGSYAGQPLVTFCVLCD